MYNFMLFQYTHFTELLVLFRVAALTWTRRDSLTHARVILGTDSSSRMKANISVLNWLPYEVRINKSTLMYKRKEGGQGVPNVPLPIPLNPGTHPFFVGFHLFALFNRQTLCIIV